jgi:hypothetical protein
MRGFDYLDTYKKSFNAGRKEEFVRTRKPVVEKVKQETGEDFIEEAEVGQEEEKVSLTERIKKMISNMFEVEDQKIY